MPKITLYVLLIALLAACSNVEQPVTSPNDDREYRFVELDNGLPVLLIEDAETDKAAASLVALRGRHSDPDAHLGMAHFLEHMLFLGTAKYPETDAFEGFITTHGGTYNAYTSTDHTNYFFDIKPEYFVEALDRFAQFFIAPLFTADYVEREKNAVHSEYQLQIKDDGWRSQAVRRVLMNPAHPDSRFQVGSLATLAKTTKKDLVDFFERHYSSDQMTLVVLGNQPLDELEAAVRERFTAIENRRLGPGPDPVAIFDRGRLPARLQYQTLKNTRRVTFNFPVGAIDALYATKPLRYIAELLAHEGEGSLHAMLKARGLIESLYGGPSRLDRGNAMLSISMELTEKGAGQIALIEDALFAYIALARDAGIEAWRYREQARVAELGFRFQEKAQPVRTVTGLSVDLARYPVEDVIRAPFMMERFEARQIGDLFARLTPDNLLVEISGPDVETDTTEAWFNVPYRIVRSDPAVRPVDAEFDIALPEPNEYVPEDLALVTPGPRPFAAATQTASPDPALAVWLATDTEFGTPRATVRLSIHVDGGLQTPPDVARAALFAKLVEDALNVRAYPAQIAGLQYRIGAGGTGFDISVSGYDDKLTELFDDITTAFAELEIDPGKFALYREAMLKDYRNFERERPFSQAMASLGHLILSSRWPPPMLAEALVSLTPEDLEIWRAARLGEVAATLFLHGNIDAADAKSLAATAAQRIALGAVRVAEPWPKRMRGNRSFRVEVEHDDAAFVMYLQGKDTSYPERARNALLAQMLRTPYFKALRTDQQLGYVVSVSPAVMRTHPGIAFIVQSPVASPAELEEATHLFIAGYLEALDAMSPEELEEHKQGFIAKLTERDKNLFARSQRLWSDLDVGVLTFDSREQIALEVEKIDREALTAALRSLVADSAGNRLVIYSAGRFGTEGVSGEPIDNVAAFKTGQAISRR